MKKLLLSLLLVSTTSMAENSITKAIKEDPWPVYKCTMQVNDKEVLTTTNKEEYKSYSMQPSNMHVYTYPISERRPAAGRLPAGPCIFVPIA